MKRTRHIARLWVLLVFIAFLLPCVAWARPALAETDSLCVGVPTDRCPMFYEDAETGEITGIGVDLMRSAAEAAHYEVTFVRLEEETLKIALDNDAYDVVMPFGSAVPSASGHESIVSDNLIQTPFTLVTEGSHTLPPLNELKVGMLQSLAAGAETVRQLYPGIEITLFDSMADCVAALRADKVDALLHNSYVWSYVLQKPSYSDLTVQPLAMFSMDFRAGTLDTPEGRATIERLNDGIATISDTFRQAITLDHTSRRLYRYDLEDYLYQNGINLLMGTLIFVALIVIAVQKQRTLRLEKEREMQLLINQDPLTGVLSLTGFKERAEELIRTHPDLPYTISYSNIRNFKYINDSLGRAAGDDLLRFWCTKSMEALSDMEAIARIEADHVVVLRRLMSEEQMAQDERSVSAPVRNYFIDQGKENLVQVCCGIYALTPDDYQQVDVDRMIDYARVAERRLRDSHKDGYAFYNPEQWEKGKRMADVLNHLPLALRSDYIQVWYQPQVDYDTGAIIGAEALCRWDHEKLGWLRPAEFIPILEETGLIFDLDRFVWERVAQDLKRWNEEGHHRIASVNVSRSDIQEGRDIPEHFRKLVETYGLSPDQLHIEITETAFVENPAILIDTTERLRALGFKVEMDDFGSGHSSLHMLKEVPVDRIKLDLHFLTTSGDPEKGRIIVSYMVQMVRSLGMSLIAEGVETVVQAEFLKSNGCVEMQGYNFYRPMPVEEFERICNEG